MSHVELGSPAFWFSQTIGFTEGPQALWAWTGTSALRVNAANANATTRATRGRRSSQGAVGYVDMTIVPDSFEATAVQRLPRATAKNINKFITISSREPICKSNKNARRLLARTSEVFRIARRAGRVIPKKAADRVTFVVRTSRSYVWSNGEVATDKSHAFRKRMSPMNRSELGPSGAALIRSELVG
jgi:hypothetical protein